MKFSKKKIMLAQLGVRSYGSKHLFVFLQGKFYLKNRQKPTATLIYTDNIIYNIYTTYIPPPPIINTFSDVKIH